MDHRKKQLLLNVGLAYWASDLPDARNIGGLSLSQLQVQGGSSLKRTSTMFFHHCVVQQSQWWNLPPLIFEASFSCVFFTHAGRWAGSGPSPSPSLHGVDWVFACALLLMECMCEPRFGLGKLKWRRSSPRRSKSWLFCLMENDFQTYESADPKNGKTSRLKQNWQVCQKALQLLMP